MVVTKLNYEGTTNSNLTNGQTYLVLGFVYNGTHPCALIQKDGGSLFLTGDVTDVTQWAPSFISTVVNSQVLQGIFVG